MNHPLKSDGQLLNEYLRGGQESSFEELVERHMPMVLGVCLRTIRNEHDAEDIAQAVFLTLHEKAETLCNRPSLGGWLYYVAQNVSRRALEAKTIRKLRENEAAMTTEPITYHPKNQNDLKELLDRELAALPEKYRLPMVLHHLEERTIEEIATTLGLGFSAVAMRISRAHEMLRKRLVRQGMTISTVMIATLLSQNATAVPTALVASTIQAVTKSVAAGIVLGTSAISSQVSTFTKIIQKMLFMEKLQSIAIILLIITGISVGCGVIAHRTDANKVSANVTTDISEDKNTVDSSEKNQSKTTKRLYIHKRDEASFIQTENLENKLHFVMIEYEGGSWNPGSARREMLDHAKHFIPIFLRWLNSKHKSSSTNEILWHEEVKLLRLSDDQIFDYPILFITGHYDYAFSDKEKENLKKYLERGGFLYIEDCGGPLEMQKKYGRFATRIKTEIKELFPDGKFKVLPFSHDIYQLPYKFPNGLPNINGENNNGTFDPPESPKKKRKAEGGEGFYIGDRMIAFYSDADTCCGWVLNGKGPWKDIPFQVGANIIYYALTH